MDWRSNVTVVLVETRKAGNIGSTARAMDNLGFSSLRLVSPREPVNEECRRMAAGSIALVEDAVTFEGFDESVADCHLLVGTTSSRGRKARRRHETPEEVAEKIIAAAASRRVGLVFGPERRGLNEHQLASCHHLVSIPSSETAPTLNVAQSVLLLCYVLSRTGIASDPRALPEVVTQGEREEMFGHIQQVLVDIGFLSRGNPGHIMDSIRHLLGQAELTPRDVQILRGIMSQMEWFATDGKQLPRDKVRKP